MQGASYTYGAPVSAAQVLGIAVATGLRLLSRQDQRVMIGCSLLLLGLLVIGSKSRG
jgi:hypothetical protein